MQCGTGSDVVDASAFTGQETIAGGPGNDVIKVGAVIGNTSQLTGTPTTELDLELANGSGSNTVTVGNNGLQINPFTESLSQFGTFGKLVVVGGGGTNTFTAMDGSISNVVLEGGSGSNFFTVSGGNVTLVGAAGSNTFTFNGPGHYLALGGSGAQTTNSFNLNSPGTYSLDGGQGATNALVILCDSSGEAVKLVQLGSVTSAIILSGGSSG